MNESGEDQEEYTQIEGSRESSPHYNTFPIDPLADNAQLTLDQLLAKQTPSESKKMIIVKRQGRIEQIEKGKKGERLVLDEGTRDELILVGRVYTPKEGTEIRNLPPEKRDSVVVLKTNPNNLFFAVSGRDSIENSVPYFEGFVLQKEKNPGDPLIVEAVGYARKWDIQGSENAGD